MPTRAIREEFCHRHFTALHSPADTPKAQRERRLALSALSYELNVPQALVRQTTSAEPTLREHAINGKVRFSLSELQRAARGLDIDGLAPRAAEAKQSLQREIDARGSGAATAKYVARGKLVVQPGNGPGTRIRHAFAKRYVAPLLRNLDYRTEKLLVAARDALDDMRSAYKTNTSDAESHVSDGASNASFCSATSASPERSDASSTSTASSVSRPAPDTDAHL